MGGLTDVGAASRGRLTLGTEKRHMGVGDANRKGLAQSLTGQPAVVRLVAALSARAWVIPLDLLFFAGNNLWFWAPACVGWRDGIRDTVVWARVYFCCDE